MDTHCHITFEGLLEKADEVVAGAKAAGVGPMITIATSPDQGPEAIRIAERHEGVYVAVGLHPHYCESWRDQSAFFSAIRPMLAHPKVVALGEMGMDRHYPDPPIELQRESFLWQLELMREQAQLPGVVHNREATDDVLPILRDSGIPGNRFVFHCFTGSDAELDAILEFGAMVSFTGVITFKNTHTLLASAARVPIERVMVETDAPFLTPEPFRKVKPNEPKYVVHVANKLAEARGMSPKEFESATDANARRFFGLT